jgi:hypothetical protein
MYEYVLLMGDDIVILDDWYKNIEFCKTVYSYVTRGLKKVPHFMRVHLYNGEFFCFTKDNYLKNNVIVTNSLNRLEIDFLAIDAVTDDGLDISSFIIEI